MAFDGVFLRLMCHELAPNLIGARVDKIYQPTKTLLVLALRSKEFNGKLMLCADPNGARIQLTKAEIENPPVPSMLCMLLRKKLIGAKLTALRQPDLERLVYLDFDTKNELGDPIVLTLVAELMGRNANLILCDGNGKVIDAIRRTDASDTTRIIMPGVTYTPPPVQNRFDLIRMDVSLAVEAVAACTPKNLATELLTAVPGISPIVCRELSFAATKEQADDLPLTAKSLQVLTGQLTDLQQQVQQYDGIPTMLADQSGKLTDITFFKPTQYGSTVTAYHADTFSELLDRFYTQRDQKARLQTKAHNLNKWLHTTLARLARTVNVRTLELAKAQDCESLRKYGELLKANLGRIPAGATVCRVVDYYDPECGEIDIPLSPALSPAQNAQKYFKEYRKQCTAAGMLEGLIRQAKADIAYLDSVQEALNRAETTADIEAIQEELQESGFLKVRGGNKKKKTMLKASMPYEFVSTDGFTIIAGRNNRQNDKLTLRESASDDLWFHTKNIPGSHVIVKSNHLPVPDTTLTQAAIIAATLSKGKDATGVAVDYCPVKRVKKPSGAAPGMVIYENYNTAYVDPDEALLKQLMKS